MKINTLIFALCDPLSFAPSTTDTETNILMICIIVRNPLMNREHESGYAPIIFCSFNALNRSRVYFVYSTAFRNILNDSNVL